MLALSRWVPCRRQPWRMASALDVMFWGALYPTLAVLPQMRARRSGHVVHITSMGGMVSVPHLLPYTCAKFAAVDLSEGLPAELGQEGIHVTTVVPGLMRTGSYLGAVSSARYPTATHQTLVSPRGAATPGGPARLPAMPPTDAVWHGRARCRDLAVPAAAHPHNTVSL